MHKSFFMFAFMFFISCPINASSLISNGGFEEWGNDNIPKNWINYSPKSAGNFNVDNSIFANGKKSLCIKGVPDSEWFVMLSEKIKVEDLNRKYEFGGMCTSKIESGKISILLRESGVDEKTIKYTDIKIPANKDWDLYENTAVKVSADTKYLQVVLLLANVSGDVWFDDIFLSETESQSVPVKKYEYENSFSNSTLTDTEKFVCPTGSADFKIAIENIEGKRNKYLKIIAKEERTNAFFQMKTMNLLPGDKYHLTFDAWSDEKSNNLKLFSEVAFMDYYGKRLNNADITISSNLKETKNISIDFQVPEKACYVEMNLGMKDYPLKSILCLDNIKISKADNADSVNNPYYWNSYWVSSVDGDIDVQGYAYYRKSFTLDELPEKAILQLASNQSADVYINGKKIGTSTSWRRSKEFDAGKALKTGKNTIAVATFNNRGASRVLFELYMLSAQKVKTVIISDCSWKFSMQKTEKWESTDFDDSLWKKVYVYGKPPIGPYGFVSYKYQGGKTALVLKEFKCPEVLNTAETSSLKMIMEAGISTEDLKTTLKVCKADTEYLSCDAVLKVKKSKDGKTVEFNTDFKIPQLLDGGEYELSLLHPGYEFKQRNGKNVFPVKIKIENSGKVSSETAKTFKVVKDNYVLIDDKYCPLLGYYLPIDIDPLPRLEYVDDFIKSGINIIIVPFDIGKKNIEKELDKYVCSVLSKYPEAYIFFSVVTDPDSEWLKNNPGEKVVFADGKTGNEFSFASKKYREYVKDYIRKIVLHVKQSKYNNKILGYNLVGGEDGQWIHYSDYGMRLPDYSLPMQAYFHEWLKNKYKDIAALNKTWKTKYNKFDEIKIPAKEKRTGSVEAGIFIDPAQNHDVIDYNKCYSDCPVDALLEFSELIKKETSGSKLVGTYYFHAFGAAYVGKFGIRNLERFLNSPYVDILNAPNYLQRRPGMSDAYPGPEASLRLHKKSHFKEEDVRTFLSKQNYSKLNTLYDSISVIKRDFILALTKHTGLWWFDLHGGWFRNDAISEVMGIEKKLMDKAAQGNEIKNQIAVFVDDKMLNYLNFSSETLLRSFISGEQKSNLGMIGAPYDCYLLSDLSKFKISDYKLFIFLDTFKVDKDIKKIIKEKVAVSGNVLLWFYAPGFISENGLSLDDMNDLTSVKMAAYRKTQKASLKTADSKNPLLKDYENRIFSVNCQLNPCFYSIDNSAEVLGRFDDGLPGFVYKKLDSGAVSIFCSIPGIPPPVLRNIAESAGVHLYVNTNDAVYATSDFFGIHSASAGRKEIKLMGKKNIYDPFTRQTVGTDTDVISIDMQKNETGIFELQPVK